MPFSPLIGNDLAKTCLLRMVAQQSVPSTLLFYGPDGVGKSLFAMAFAEKLMGRELSQNDPDLHIFRPEGKSAIHTIENIRKLIDEVAMPPYSAPVKVFIIHDAHQMLPSSSNALLKILEEPSIHSYFILLTNSLDAMLPTILSRSRKLPFFPIPQSQIEIFVKEKWQKKPEEARRIAFLSHGSLAKAQLQALQTQLPWRSPLIDCLTLQLPLEYPQLVKLASVIEENCTVDNEEEESSSIMPQADAVFEEIVAWYRDLQILKEKITPEYLYHLDHLDRLKTALSLPVPPLEKVIDQVSLARLALQRNVRLRVVLEHFFCGVTDALKR